MAEIQWHDRRILCIWMLVQNIMTILMCIVMKSAVRETYNQMRVNNPEFVVHDKYHLWMLRKDMWTKSTQTDLTLRPGCCTRIYNFLDRLWSKYNPIACVWAFICLVTATDLYSQPLLAAALWISWIVCWIWFQFYMYLSVMRFCNSMFKGKVNMFIGAIFRLVSKELKDMPKEFF